METKSHEFPRQRRLTVGREFKRVLETGRRSADQLFLILFSPNGGEAPRLGLTVSRKIAGNAVHRNRIKRVIRESFRTQKSTLPAVDLVVMTRKAAGNATNREMNSSLDKHWQRIKKQCVTSSSA